MTRFICDRCGSEYTVDSRINVTISPLVSTNPFGSIQGEVKKFSLDFCDDCRKDIEILLTKKIKYGKKGE